MAVGFLEESWSRNLLNMMTTPLTELEYLTGVALFGLFKLVLGVGVVALACWGLFSFAITDLCPGMVRFRSRQVDCRWCFCATRLP